MADAKNSLKRMMIQSFFICVIILICFYSRRLYITTSVRAYILPKSPPDDLRYRYLDSISGSGKKKWRDINAHKQNSKRFAKGQEKLKSVNSENDQNKQNSLFKLNESVAKETSEDNESSNKFDKNASKRHMLVAGNEVKRKKPIKLGILIPSSTRKMKKPILSKLSLTTVCLPSLYKTFEQDYLYQIYIGIDQGDYLESVQNELTKLFSNITVVIVVSPKKSFTRSVNAIARKAYEDGADYFVRINDDTSFETKNWTWSALDILLKYTPPNIGVVGPTCKEGNTRILTHDMVHRTHFEIFGFYYPIYFDNWWADDWITELYQPERSTKLTKWIVKHHMGVHGTRYDVDMKKFARLKEIVSYDRLQLAEYLNRISKLNLV